MLVTMVSHYFNETFAGVVPTRTSCLELWLFLWHGQDFATPSDLLLVPPAASILPSTVPSKVSVVTSCFSSIEALTAYFRFSVVTRVGFDCRLQIFYHVSHPVDSILQVVLNFEFHLLWFVLTRPKRPVPPGKSSGIHQ